MANPVQKLFAWLYRLGARAEEHRELPPGALIPPRDVDEALE